MTGKVASHDANHRPVGDSIVRDDLRGDVDHLPGVGIVGAPAPVSLARRADPDWRDEVTGRGRFWQWRKGSGKERTSRYGGRFDELDPKRKKAYVKNRRTKARPKKSA